MSEAGQVIGQMMLGSIGGVLLLGFIFLVVVSVGGTLMIFVDQFAKNAAASKKKTTQDTTSSR